MTVAVTGRLCFEAPRTLAHVSSAGPRAASRRVTAYLYPVPVAGWEDGACQRSLAPPRRAKCQWY